MYGPMALSNLFAAVQEGETLLSQVQALLPEAWRAATPLLLSILSLPLQF